MSKLKKTFEPWLILYRADILSLKKIGFVCFASLIVSILELATLLLVSSINKFYNSFNQNENIAIIAFCLIFLCTASFLLRSYCIYKSNIYSAYIGNMIGKRSLESLLGRGYENLSQQNISEIFVQLTTYVSQVSGLVIAPILQSLNIIFTAILISIATIKIIGHIGLIIILFIGISYIIFASKLRKKIEIKLSEN